MKTTASHERGAALIVVVLISALLSGLGLALLQTADDEVRIAARHRDSSSLMLVAETGAHAVKAWFDMPLSGDPGSPPARHARHAFLARHDLREASFFDRARRLIDTDANPATPALAADGTPGREMFRQGHFVSPGSLHLDLLGKPWRGDVTVSLMGIEAGPDLSLRDRPGEVDLLDRINADLFPDQPATGRIESIDIFGPVPSPDGRRLGFATVRITAARYRRIEMMAGVPVVAPGQSPLGRAVVRMGLGEIPLNLPRGPLESCGSITARGRLRVRWGKVIAEEDIALPDRMDQLDTLVASAWPYEDLSRRLGGGGHAAWLAAPDSSVEDPWLKIVAGGRLLRWETLGDQPFPWSPTRPIDHDHSNLFQRVAGITCPRYDYQEWKSLVTAGLQADRRARYFAWDPATGLFRENGAGPSRSVRDWTHGASGIFFFDTMDGLPPGPSNRTPAVSIRGGAWSTAGFIYLNAFSFEVDGAGGVQRAVLPPGEPFDDADHDAVRSSAEVFVNLRYAETLDSGTALDDILKESAASQSASVTAPDGESYAVTTASGRDGRGIPILEEINLFGVVYNSGDIVAEGDAIHYGSLVAGRHVVQRTTGAPTPVVYFDDRLNTGAWPPPEIAMPRTYITWWQNSLP